MSEAKTGNTVKIHYTGKLDNGTIFDSSKQREPFQFTIGQGQVIPGFEESVLGMQTGETKSFNIPCDKAYGQKQDELIIEIPKENIPNEVEYDVGTHLQIQQPNGQVVAVLVKSINENTVTIDANHPLAGENLTFEIELLEVS